MEVLLYPQGRNDQNYHNSKIDEVNEKNWVRIFTKMHYYRVIQYNVIQYNTNYNYI